MCEITILHLSDIHFKKKKEEENKTFRQDVQRKLIKAVKTHVKEHENLDFVAVTGDIAFSGKKHEYGEALEFFEKLKAVLPGKTEFLAVPGNHDVDRDKVKKLFSLHRVVHENEVEQFLENEEYIKDFVDVKFEAYQEFTQRLNPALYLPEEKEEETETYYWVRNFAGKGVSFLGLNSAWACEGDNDRFNIALGYPQVMSALEKAKDIENRVVLMHHPPFNWLKDLEYGKTRLEMFSKCQLLVHGHTHSDNALVFKDPADTCICLYANASYTDDKDGFIGFQFLEVEFSSKGTKVTVWPYTFSEKRNEFVPDRERWRGQAGNAWFVLEAYGEEGPPGPGLPGIPEDYRNWVREFHSILPMDQLARKGEVVLISLPAVYIPLETANPFHKHADETAAKKGDKKEKGEPEEPPTIDIEELMGRVNCLLLRGKAGMGKTTLIKHLAYGLTHGSGPETLRGYLPLMVFLKDLWPVYAGMLKEEAPHITFEMLLAEYLEKQGCPLSMETINAYLSRGKGLVLVDGLDEVPEELRGDLVDLVHRFQFKHKNNRFLITGRPHGIEVGYAAFYGLGVPPPLRDIELLDDKKSQDFISRWFRAVSGQATGVGQVTAADMIADIQQHEHADVFTGNPLLLTALCIFYLVGGKRIPDQRADLYDRIAANLLYRRFHDPGDKEKANRVREFLMLLAFTMQTRNIKSIDAGDAAELLKQVYPQEAGESLPDYKKRLEALFNEIEPMCGLLSRQGSGEVEFVHLSFQEFLAAKYMLDSDTDYKQYLENSWWKETILLYAGLMNLEMKKKSNEIVGDMIEMNQSNRVQLLGAEALRDFQLSRREDKVVQAAKGKLLAIMESEAELQDRFDAGEILGTLGDPRINVLKPPMEIVKAGEFIRGSDESDEEDEKPERSIYLDEFTMGKYPVTNQEFKAFIKDDGYNNEELWIPEGWLWRKKKNISEPGYWHDRKWNGPNFPVVGVSWYEASAYAKWLSRKRKDKYVLPTEAQWEKAARGSGGFSYPWGNTWEEKENRCNWYELGLRRTSPVGIFPAGASPYGCMDMAGNVWEWCADWFDEDYYKKSPDRNPMGPKDGSARVYRGGSWISNRRNCRGAYRNYNDPDNRGSALGFRLARLF